MKRNWIIVGVVILLAGLAVFQTVTAQKKKAAVPEGVGVKPGLAAPAIELPALDGQTYKVGGKRDKPLLLNFWASWCVPCREEAPDLKRLYDKYQDKFDIYGVNVTAQDDLTNAKNMVKEFDFKFPILLDYLGASPEAYKYQAIPTSFLIDANGTVVEVIHVFNAEQLEKKIVKLTQ
jgi:thiol-disulfide isomerase/thioredoxin